MRWSKYGVLASGFVSLALTATACRGGTAEPGKRLPTPITTVEHKPAVATSVAGDGARSFTFTYKVEVAAVPKGQPVDLFIPIAQSDPNQEIVSTIEASIPGEQGVEQTYGNTFWHGHLDESDGNPISIKVEYQVVRKVFKRANMTAAASREHTPQEKKELAKFLGANEKVPVAGDLISRIRADLPENDGTQLGKARAIYDYVIANMEYKKVGNGWGNGDTYWACSEKYGNCTDFHALFISLARAEGIPARFEIGFPVPEDRPEGTIGGYHCWVEFHIAGIGWIPVDASEAWKHPDKKEFLFGAYPADRVQFTVGRDLRLGKGHKSRALNYFVYPHLEVDGKSSEGYEKEFKYKS